MKVDLITHSRDGYSKFSKMAGGRLLDLVQPELDPFDPLSPKPYPRIKHEVRLQHLHHCMKSVLRRLTLTVLQLLAFNGQKFRGSRDDGQ